MNGIDESVRASVDLQRDGLSAKKEGGAIYVELEEGDGRVRQSMDENVLVAMKEINKRKLCGWEKLDLTQAGERRCGNVIVLGEIATVWVVVAWDIFSVIWASTRGVSKGEEEGWHKMGVMLYLIGCCYSAIMTLMIKKPMWVWGMMLAGTLLSAAMIIVHGVTLIV